MISIASRLKFKICSSCDQYASNCSCRNIGSLSVLYKKKLLDMGSENFVGHLQVSFGALPQHHPVKHSDGGNLTRLRLHYLENARFRL